MEYSIDCVRSVLEMLNLNTIAPQDEEDDGKEIIKKPIAMRRFRGKWLKKSKKSVVRMLAAYAYYWNNNTEPVKRKKFNERSIVRRIGSKLPLRPSKRAYFEIFMKSNKAMMVKAKTFVEENLNNVKSYMPEVGLADVGLFSWDEFEDETITRKDIVTRSTLDSSGLSVSQMSEVSSDDCALPPRCVKKGKKLREKGSSEKQISDLKDELANLRAQIAMIVSAQEKKPDIEQTIPTAPPPPPVIAPPPPPLPVIRKPPQPLNMKKNNNKSEKSNDVPSMSQVLVGLSAVKLKSSNIQRSPGGTPLKMKSGNANDSSTDPADIIANALRKKFAKARRSLGSPAAGKENQMSPHSGFSPSPLTTPQNSPVTSSPHCQRKSRRRSGLSGKTIILSPVNENTA